MQTKLFIGVSNTFAKSNNPDIEIINIDAIGKAPTDVKFKFGHIGTPDFKENSVDEIIALDTIARFQVTQVDLALANWKKLLKKGGIISLEQPDLIKTCINVLRKVTNPEDANTHYINGMQNLYGYWSDTEHNKVFQWCWTPETLIQVVANAGFVDIKEVNPSEGNESTHFKIVAKNA